LYRKRFLAGNILGQELFGGGNFLWGKFCGEIFYGETFCGKKFYGETLG